MLMDNNKRKLVFSLCVLLILQFCVAEGTLVASWDFEDRSDEEALDPAGNHGKIEGAIIATGIQEGKGLEFDGDDYVEIDSPKLYAISSSSFSWSAWYKPRSPPSCDDPDRSYQAVICKESPNTFMGYNCQKRMRAIIYFSDGNYIDVISTKRYQPSIWYHLVQTVDDSSDKTILKLYVDGTLVGSKTSPGTLRNLEDKPLRIGTCVIPEPENHSIEPANGTIDEVRVYDYALDADAVKGLYEEGSSKPSPASSPLSIKKEEVPIQNPKANGETCIRHPDCDSNNCGAGICCKHDRLCCTDNSQCDAAESCDTERFYCVTDSSTQGLTKWLNDNEYVVRIGLFIGAILAGGVIYLRKDRK